MFYDNPKVQKIHDKIFYYPDFIPTEKVKEINEAMKKYERKDLVERDYSDPIEWYSDKLSPVLPELMEVWEMLSEFLAPEYIIHPALHLQCIHPGDGGMFLHCDSPGEGNHDMLTQTDKWNTCCVIHYGAVIYFGEFEGGENLYPNQGLEFPVKPGDLIIHGAHSDYQHGVKEVTSGARYAFANFVLPKEKNPNTFFVWNTPEEKERRKDLINLWLRPIVA
jgi:hypothetical protein